MTVTVRFAPSPTGKLHVGNIRTALVNWLYARAQGGKFILRIDDTDSERSTKEFEDGILADLAWLGLTYDGFMRQSERMARYAAATQDLKSRNLLYPCYETSEELDLKRKVQLGRGKPPVYDRAALKLSDAQKQSYADQGITPHWRFLLTHETVHWADLVHGEVAIDTVNLSDPVLVRADGQPLYTLPSICDDVDLAITHVIRGEDHVTNTAVQIQLFKALGATPPTFAHFPLLTGAGGEGLSKRLGSLAIADLRDQGIEPMALNSLLARLGTSDPVEPHLTLDELAAGFDITHIGRAPVKFDPRDLDAMNQRILHMMPYAMAASQPNTPDGSSPRHYVLNAEPGSFTITGHDANLVVNEAFWNAVRPNLNRRSEAAEWWAVVTGPLTPVITDPAFLAEAGALLPTGDFTTESWGLWTKAVAAKTGRKGRELFMPLRLALTGRGDGPEMKSLLPFIGPGRAHARLRGETA